MLKNPKYARLLFGQALGALVIASGVLIVGEADQIKALVKNGDADDSKAAVDYCKEQGMEAIEYVDPIVAEANAAAAELAAKKEALEGAIALLEKKISGVTDVGELPGLKSDLAAKQAELQALPK